MMKIHDNAFDSGLRPDSILLVSDWADQNRVLSQTASAEPGKFRTERTPYLKEIMDALSPSSPIEKVIFMKGSQIGGTEAGNNWIGYIIDQAPGATLVVQPTVEMGKRWSKGRLAPLIEDTPCLRDKVSDPRSRDSGNTVQSKEFPGGIVVITGANSAVGLRSMPVRYLFLDEIDAYPPDADSEGDPLTLAIQRTSTFARRKIFIVSTPTIQGLSRIEKEFNESDQRYYFVPCPHCEHFQTLKWENIKYDNTVPTEAVYVCENCKRHIRNHHKTEMLARGEWRATRQETDQKNSCISDKNSVCEERKQTPQKVAGFHLSSLYSPVGWLDWGTCAQNYELAKDNEQLLKAWMNTTLGLPWTEKGEAPDWGTLFDRRENYRIGSVPRGGYVLTAGVDVQGDRLEIEIVAWGQNKESWSVDYRIIYGSPSDARTWESLTSILNEEFESEDRIHRKINMLAIDAGFSTQEVYAWVRNQSPHNVMAVKGVDNSLMPLNAPRKVDVNYKGRRLKNSVRLWTIGVSIIKSEIYSFLKKRKKTEDEDIPHGYMHLPEYNTEYFKQLTAEQLVTRIVKGYPRREWQKTRERNEALDCRVYARAAAIALGIDRWSDNKWEQLSGQNFAKTITEHQRKDNYETLPTQISMKKVKQRPRVLRSGWM